MADIEIVEVPQQMVISVQRTGSYKEMGKAFADLGGYAVSKSAEFVGAPFVLMHEQGQAEAEKADAEGTAIIDVNFPIAARIDESDEFKIRELPAASMAKIVHMGSYDGLGATYQELFGWIYSNGKQQAGPIREVYLNDPNEVKPEDLITEIYVPVA